MERVSIKMRKKINHNMLNNCLYHSLDSLTAKEMETIFIIGCKGKITMGEIAEKLGVTVSTPTTTVNRLIGKKYVERHVGEEDRRLVVVSLTEEGFRLYNYFLELKLKNLELLFNILSEDEISMFRLILKKIDKEL